MNHNTLMKVAHAISQDSKCVSLQVGAVVVQGDSIVSTGYNGTPRGMLNCNEVVGRTISREEHHEWSKKNEIHAEMNALLSCPVSLKGGTIYVTDSPCFNCAKHIIAAGIKAIYFDRLYDRFEEGEWEEVISFCSEANVSLIKLYSSGVICYT